MQKELLEPLKHAEKNNHMHNKQNHRQPEPAEYRMDDPLLALVQKRKPLVLIIRLQIPSLRKQNYSSSYFSI